MTPKRNGIPVQIYLDPEVKSELQRLCPKYAFSLSGLIKHLLIKQLHEWQREEMVLADMNRK